MMRGQPATNKQVRTHWWVMFLIVLYVGFALTDAVQGQVSPDEHAKHHPEQKSGAPAPSKAGPGGMGDMDKMMEKMGAPKPKELYPSLMSLPDLPLEKREEVQQQAHERMKSGTVMMAEALDALLKASPSDDYAVMQEATARLRGGLSQFESGLAAHRALAEGKAPRNVALQWFKREMNLLSPVSGEQRHGVFGLSWFHFFVMLILIVFFVLMIWMYFFKMRRAAALLERLTSNGNTNMGGSGSGTTPIPPPSSTVPEPDELAKKRETKSITSMTVPDTTTTSVREVTSTTVTFQRSDKSAPLSSEKTILDVADEIGVDIDNSCRTGTCGICKIKLLSGTVAMECEDALEQKEKAEGIILACQAKSNENVVVDV